jgi:hypothetical protein
MRKKVLIGALVVAGWVLAPFGSGAVGSPQALDCPANAAAACSGVQVILGEVCYGTPTEVPTIGFITVDVEGSPSVVCPDLPV